MSAAELTPLAPQAQIGLMMAVLFVLMLGAELRRAPRYSCPSCGTTNAKEHSEECAWSKHYGEDL